MCPLIDESARRLQHSVALYVRRLAGVPAPETRALRPFLSCALIFGVSVVVPQGSLYTGLHGAAMNGRLRCLRALLAAGADKEAQDEARSRSLGGGGGGATLLQGDL